MARITMRKVQETKLSEVFTQHLALLSHEEACGKALRSYEQHASAISKKIGYGW